MKRIILAGGSGFIGQALAAHFLRSKWEVVILTRSPKKAEGDVREIQWEGRTLGPWRQELAGAAAVVNWTEKSVDCRYNARNR
jgi:NAD dependent epimerase/dehydratase family enzyme